MKEDKLLISPSIIRRGIENTCKELDGSPIIYAGHGLIQVHKAYTWFKKYANHTINCHFDISVNNGRGIYLRNLEETNCISTHNVFVKPVFHEDTLPEIKTKLDMKLLFKSNVDWLKFPDRISMNHGGRGFNIIVNPTRLAPGLHTATVIAYQDPTSTSINEDGDGEGTLFEVCITVTKPEGNMISLNNGVALKLEPGIIQRSFLTPPRGATWCDIIITDRRNNTNLINSNSYSPTEGGNDDVDNRMIVVHLLQLASKEPYSKYEKQQYLRLRPGQVKTTSISLLPNNTSSLEVCIGQFWSSPGETSIQLQVDFRGVDVNPNQILAGGLGEYPMIKFNANLKAEEVEPIAKLNIWRKSLLPSQTGKLTCLGSRDILPNGKKCYELLLDYIYNSNEDNVTIKPRSPLINGYLYDSLYDSQLLMIFDENKQLMGTSDVFPENIKLKKKGKYFIKLSIRHDSLTQLELMNKMLLYIDVKLSNDITLPICNHSAEVASSSSNGGGSMLLLQGRSRSIVLGDISNDKLPKGVSAGDVLLGRIHMLKNCYVFLFYFIFLLQS